MTIIPARRTIVAGIIGLVSLAACSSDDEASTPASVNDSTEATAVLETVDTPTTPVPDDTAATIAPAPSSPVGAPAATDPVPATDAVPATDPVRTTDATTPPAAAGDTLTIAEFAYSEFTATAGTEFTISNEDSFAHTVTHRDAIFDVGLDGDASDTLTIAAPGTYEIFCRIHPSMTGTITVT